MAERMESGKPLIVGISGPICSGKTTLATALARTLDFVAVSETTLGAQYIADLHANPPRWAFEAQVAFLAAKAAAVHNSLKRSSRLVLDRTFAEDREVFAHYFAAKGYVNSRSLQAYESVFLATTIQLPTPRVVVACTVSLQTAFERLAKRDDAKRSLPREFVAAIHERYLARSAALPAGPTTIQLDSEALDWRDGSVVADIARTVQGKLDRK